MRLALLMPWLRHAMPSLPSFRSWMHLWWARCSFSVAQALLVVPCKLAAAWWWAAIICRWWCTEVRLYDVKKVLGRWLTELLYIDIKYIIRQRSVPYYVMLIKSFAIFGLQPRPFAFDFLRLGCLDFLLSLHGRCELLESFRIHLHVRPHHAICDGCHSLVPMSILRAGYQILHHQSICDLFV